MALSFPLPLATLFTGVDFVRVSFTLSENLRVGRTAGGGRVVNSYGTRFFYGHCRLRMLPHAQQRDLEGLFDAIRGERGATFFVTPIPNLQTGLQNGTLSNLTTAYTAVVNGVGAGRVIPRGTLLSFPWGSRYAMHRTVEQVTANGSGVATLDVEPYIKPGWTAGVAVNLTSPIALAGYVPGSYRVPEYEAGIATAIEFDWEQIV